MVDEVAYVDECPAGNCNIRFVGMTPDEYREKHAQDGVCENGKLSGLFAFPTDEYRKKCEEGLES